MDIEELITTHQICKRCVGRLFSRSEFNLSDTAIQIAESRVDAKLLKNCTDELECSICIGLVSISLEVASRAVSKLKTLEFSTFLVGCRVEKSIIERQSIFALVNPAFIDIKEEIRREVSRFFQEELNKETDHGIPDLNILIDTQKKRFDLDIRSLYILGRYFKYKRGLPQTKWPCSACKGKKCEKCNYSGQQYPLTVETAISPPFLEASGAKSAAFHGAGREDIDALMLGSGRPFVLELKSPIRRNLDLENLQEQVNKREEVGISDLQIAEKEVVVKLKQGSPDSSKTYRALVEFETPISDDTSTIIEEFGQSSKILQQRTPQRVSHRRADKIREKTIMSVKVQVVDTRLLELEIEAQGGAYIKEFISGDSGRTIPSISSLVLNNALCVELDVLAVDDQGVFSS